jgi:hypothetical protein
MEVHRISEVRLMEIHTAEPLVSEPSPLEVEVAIAKLKKYKLPSIGQVVVDLSQTGGEILCSEIHKPVNSILNKEE